MVLKNGTTVLIRDLGHGKFDGACLVQNFENLNPANTLWSKQYNLYANIDKEVPRYLGFERWWGGHVVLSGEEMQYIVDNLFVGNISSVVPSAKGLRTERRIGHVFAMDAPTYPRPLFITDAAINVYPTLEEKVDIFKNAIQLAHALNIPQPKVAILSAVETVNPKIPATIEATDPWPLGTMKKQRIPSSCLCNETGFLFREPPIWVGFAAHLGTE